jgi:hypothetical protein
MKNKTKIIILVFIILFCALFIRRDQVHGVNKEYIYKQILKNKDHINLIDSVLTKGISLKERYSNALNIDSKHHKSIIKGDSTYIKVLKDNISEDSIIINVTQRINLLNIYNTESQNKKVIYIHKYDSLVDKYNKMPRSYFFSNPYIPVIVSKYDK